MNNKNDIDSSDNVGKNISALWMGDFSTLIEDAIDLSKQAQINGVDLTVKEIFAISGEGVIDFDNSKRVIPDHKPLDLTEDNYWKLQPGSYIVRYNEIVKVPLNALGILLPRSSLLRMGATIVGAWWDSGYQGRGQGLLIIGHPIKIYQNARIAQIVFLRSKPVKKGYSGQYQLEDTQ
ncbi:MAG: deoxyuridine 5'-triphosphate nucleotidohydrolase [Candidatus Heimdallarchaeota archaeon]|nr:deoxyuridine 5'-triphosphate nucleotidohydrolase [Candidatus Heimdallarchaeota archaeon]